MGSYNFFLNHHGSVHLKNILIYPTRRNVTQFILSGNCSTCFGWYLRQSSGAQTTVFTASGIWYLVYHTQTSSNSSTIAAGSRNGVTNTRCCRYTCLRSWYWVVVPPETCKAVSWYNKLCNVASFWIYIGIFEYSFSCFVVGSSCLQFVLEF